MNTGESFKVAPAPAGESERSARVVLFDFDGVLFRGDAFSVFVRERYARGFLRRLLLLPALPWMLLSWPISWRLPVRTLVHVALLGCGEKKYVAMARAFGAALARKPGQFYRDGLQALRRHQAEGDRVVVVTGCEQHVATAILDELGLRDVEVLASEFRPGWLGMRVKLHNIGRRKVQKLHAAGIKEWQLAYSDSLIDVPMLKPAAEAVLVNGTPRLCKKLERALGRTVTCVDWY